MRQLDLFGSLFDPAPSNSKPEDVKDVATREVTSKADAEPAKPSGLPAGLSATTSSDNINTSAGDQGTEEQNNKNTTLNLSLFEDAFSLDEQPPTINNEVGVIDELPAVEQPEITVENEEIFQEAQLVQTEIIGEDEKDVQPRLTKSPETEITSYNTEVAVVKTEIFKGGAIEAVASSAAVKPVANEVNTGSETQKTSSDTGVITKRKVGRPKKIKAPELETSGAIIFDDGKITVKLKNRNPFTPVTVAKEKEKKERVKKVPQKRGRKSFKEIDAEVDLIDIPEDEILFQKQYYPISEVAKWFRVNTSLLRFWENEFDVLKPRKNRKGDRLFRPEDVKNLQLIYQLLRQRKYTIEGAKEYIKTNKKKADIQLQLTNTLQKFKSFLLDLKANLQA